MSTPPPALYFSYLFHKMKKQLLVLAFSLYHLLITIVTCSIFSKKNKIKFGFSLTIIKKQTHAPRTSFADHWLPLRVAWRISQTKQKPDYYYNKKDLTSHVPLTCASSTQLLLLSSLFILILTLFPRGVKILKIVLPVSFGKSHSLFSRNQKQKTQSQPELQQKQNTKRVIIAVN